MGASMQGKRNLLGEIEDLQKFVRGSSVCLCCLAMEDSETEIAEALKSALANPRINASTIGKWLRSKGVRCSDYSVRRHRRGECAP